MIRMPVSFKKLVDNYPDPITLATEQLLNKIGGEVRKSMRDGDNTCTVRLSCAFNASGVPVRRSSGIWMLKGASYVPPGTMSHHAAQAVKRDLFILRVSDMRRYLTHHYGNGVSIFDGKAPDPFKAPLSGLSQGIVVFQWGGTHDLFTATGHVDLFRVITMADKPPTFVPACVGHCYFMPGPMTATLWEMSP